MLKDLGNRDFIVKSSGDFWKHYKFSFVLNNFGKILLKLTKDHTSHQLRVSSSNNFVELWALSFGY